MTRSVPRVTARSWGGTVPWPPATCCGASTSPVSAALQLTSRTLLDAELGGQQRGVVAVRPQAALGQVRDRHEGRGGVGVAQGGVRREGRRAPRRRRACSAPPGPRTRTCRRAGRRRRTSSPASVASSDDATQRGRVADRGRRGRAWRPRGSAGATLGGRQPPRAGRGEPAVGVGADGRLALLVAHGAAARRRGAPCASSRPRSRGPVFRVGRSDRRPSSSPPDARFVVRPASLACSSMKESRMRHVVVARRRDR